MYLYSYAPPIHDLFLIKIENKINRMINKLNIIK